LSGGTGVAAPKVASALALHPPEDALCLARRWVDKTDA
jgi:hypothetical protein